MSANKHDYKADLLKRLKGLHYAVLYLSAAAKESQETFFLALRDVAEAQKGMAQLASDANVNRENLYRMLSESGNPQYSKFVAVLDALGIDQEFKLKTSPSSVNIPLCTGLEMVIMPGGATIGYLPGVKTDEPVRYISIPLGGGGTKFLLGAGASGNTELAKVA